MAKNKALVDPTLEKKSLGWYGGLSGCLESSRAVDNPAKKKLKDSKPPESSSDEDDIDDDEKFDILANRILGFLHLASGQEEEWASKLENGLISSTILIGSLSSGSKTVYDALKSTKFEDVAKTTEYICTILAKTHWAAGGLLVVAAILHNIQKKNNNDKECLELLESIHTFAVSISRLNRLQRTHTDMQHNLKRAQILIAKGAAMCLEVIQSTRLTKFLSTEGNEKKISSCREQLNRLQSEIAFQLTVALYAEPYETKGKKYSSTGHPHRKGHEQGTSQAKSPPEDSTHEDQDQTGSNTGKTDSKGHEQGTNKAKPRPEGSFEGQDQTGSNAGKTDSTHEDQDQTGSNTGKPAEKIQYQLRRRCLHYRKRAPTTEEKNNQNQPGKPQGSNIGNPPPESGDGEQAISEAKPPPEGNPPPESGDGEQASSEAKPPPEDPATRIKEMLELQSQQKPIAVFVWGEEDTGKGDLADEVCSLIGGDWIHVTVENSNIDDSVEGLAGVTLWRREISEELPSESEGKVGSTNLSASFVTLSVKEQLFHLRMDKNVLLYVDNVISVEILKKLLGKILNLNKKTKTRLLVTDDNKHVMSTLDGSKFQKRHYVMQPLSYEDTLQFLETNLPNAKGKKDSLLKIIKICKGYKNQMEIIFDILYRIKDKTDFGRLFKWMEKKDPSFKELKEYISCEEKVIDLPEYIKDALFDICSFFSNWEWTNVACILGNDALKKLEELQLLKRESFRVSVPNIVRQFGVSLSKGNRVNNVASLYKSLCRKELGKIKGIWLLENEFPFYLYSEQLDKMCGSLRVLALGDHTILKGECKETFKELIYFQVGRVTDHPFNIINLNQASFLENISKKDMGLASEKMQIPLTLRMVKLKAKLVEDCIKLQKLVPKACKLVEVDISGSDVDDLGKEFCELYALERLILNNCNKIASLPERFGKLRSLKMLDLSHCNELTSLPSNFGWLSALEKVNLSYCKKLKDLPDSMGLLTSVREIDLSYCKKIQSLPKSFVKLSTLCDLQMKACSHLCELPEGFEKLGLKKLSLESCKRLKALPQGTGQQMLSLTTVSLSWCLSIPELSVGFINLIKTKVQHLILADCTGLRTLPEEFSRDLSRLKTLNLSGCRSLQCLPKRLRKLECLEKLNLSSCVKLEESSILLRRLPSLREINLSNCPALEGSCLKRLSKLKSLQFVDIHDSPYLVEQWEQMTRQNTDWNFVVATGRPGLESPPLRSHRVFPESSAAMMTKENSPFFNDKWFFANANGQAFYPSTLEEGTTVAVIFYRSHDKEELLELGNMLDELHITCRKLQVVHVGRSVTALPRELAGRHRICSCDNYEALVFFEKKLRTIESFNEKIVYLMIISEVVISDKSKDFAPWRSITNSSLKDYKMALPAPEYFRLKEFVDTQPNTVELLQALLATKKTNFHIKSKSQVASSPRLKEFIDTQPSNVELLRALLLTKEINFLIKSKKQMGIEQLKGKFIFLLISWLDKFKEEQKTFENVYKNLEKRMQDKPITNKACFEVVWIPIVSHGRGTAALHEESIQNVTWPSIANPWSMNPSAKQYLRMHYSLHKLPLFIAISPQGQIHFENFIPLDVEREIEALYEYIKSLSNSK